MSPTLSGVALAYVVASVGSSSRASFVALIEKFSHVGCKGGGITGYGKPNVLEPASPFQTGYIAADNRQSVGERFQHSIRQPLRPTRGEKEIRGIVVIGHGLFGRSQAQPGRPGISKTFLDVAAHFFLAK